VILFVGGVASNLVANDLQQTIGSYRRWVWLVFAIALVVTVVVAIAAARKDNSTTAEEYQTVTAGGERSVAIGGKVRGSKITTGNKNVVANKIHGDDVARDKIIYINQTASPAVNALHQLRSPVGDFVGREQEIKNLINALRRDSHACISGMGGIGKTELALFVAEQLKADYPDAQFFINLQGTDAKPRAPEEVLANCIRAFLGPEVKLPEDRDQLSQLYRSQLSDRRVLLLLDNAADSLQVRQLLPPTGSALLVTSRQAVVLPRMTPLTLHPLTDEEARQLLLEIAPRAEPAAEQICTLCGYLPLAIRAAGSLLAVTTDLDPVDYATQLKDERNRIERIGMEGVEKDVAASFNLSYERLRPEAARVFRFLFVFPGTFDAAAEEAVCGDAGHAQLSDLTRHSLVLYDPSTKRYRLHDLARLFAGSKLSDEERTIVQKHHATHYRDVLGVANDFYEEGGAALLRGLALFDLEWANIEAGLAWVAAKGAECDQDVAKLGMTYAAVGVYVLNLRFQAREWIRWLEIALAAARRLKDRYYQANALGSLGVAYWSLGENQRAIQFHEQALLIHRELGDRRNEGAALGNLGVAYWSLKETRTAIDFHEQQLLIVRELGDRRVEGNALTNLGLAYDDLGETERSIQFYEQALVIDREIGDRRGEGIDLWNISLALDRLGQRARAIEYAEQSLVIRDQIEDPKAANVREKLALWREGTKAN